MITLASNVKLFSQVRVNQRNRFLPNVCGFLLPARPQWVEPAGREEWKSGGEQKSAYIEQKTVTLIYPYPTFYSHKCCHIVINQSVCKCQSLSPQSNICSQDWSLPKWSTIQNSPLRLGSQPFLQILDQSGKARQWQQLQLIMIL